MFLQRLVAWGCVFCLPPPFPAPQGFACRVSINVDNLGPLPSFTSWVTGSAKEKMAQRSPHQVGFEKSPSFQHILSPGPPQKPLNYYAECIQLEQTTHSSRSHDHTICGLWQRFHPAGRETTRATGCPRLERNYWMVCCLWLHKQHEHLGNLGVSRVGLSLETPILHGAVLPNRWMVSLVDF